MRPLIYNSTTSELPLKCYCNFSIHFWYPLRSALQRVQSIADIEQTHPRDEKSIPCKSELDYLLSEIFFSYKYWTIMSHAIVRGKPTPAQIYLDEILDAILEQDRAIQCEEKKRDSVNLAQILYYCLQKEPDGVAMINGSTNKKISNAEMLQSSISVARMFQSMGLKEKTVLVIIKNNETLPFLMNGGFFAGTVLLFLDPNSTSYELLHFLNLATPSLVLCERDRYDDVLEAIKKASVPPNVIHDEDLTNAIKRDTEDVNSFILPSASLDSVAMLLPTSGSTGLPKAALITQRALIAHLPTLWGNCMSYNRALFMSTAQWMTCTSLMSSCPVFNITIVTSPIKTTEHVLQLIENYNPCWMLLSPALLTSLVPISRPHQFKGVKTIVTTGASPSPSSIEALQNILPLDAKLYNSYGMTECQGFITQQTTNTPQGSVGQLANIVHYKLVAKDETEVLSPNTKGELYLKNDRVFIKGYLNNTDAYEEMMTPDGWMKTGDVFYEDELHNLFFIERKKFWFKYLNYQISPEELEHLISSVPGVQECVVGGVEGGPAAAVVPVPGRQISRELIHKVIEESLSDYKKLRGGVVFVERLPKTHSGKLHRKGCNDMILQLIEEGKCYY